MSTTTLPPDGFTPAPKLADVLPPRKERSKLGMFIYRHPTIAVGGFMVSLFVLMAIFAPLLWTVDPTALAPARRAETAALGWKSWVAGNLATAMTGAVIGIVGF